MNAKVWERRVDPHFGYLRTEFGCEIVDWSDKGLAGNERGQESQIRAGAPILDIGPDFERRLVKGASPYYLAELRLADKMGAEVLSIPSRVVDLLVK